MKGVISMENTLFVTADKVASDLGVSKPYAYKLVRQMNDELNKKGFLTVAGRWPPAAARRRSSR